MNLSSPQSALLAVALTVLSSLMTLVVHAVFAFGVLRDAKALVREGRRTALVDPLVWALATFLGGVYAATAYWAIHHSTLFPQGHPKGEADPEIA